MQEWLTDRGTSTCASRNSTLSVSTLAWLGLAVLYHSTLSHQLGNNLTGRGKVGNGLGKVALSGTGKIFERQHLRNNEACYKSVGTPWRSEANLRFDLRRNPRCAESFLGERYSGRCYVHRTR